MIVSDSHMLQAPVPELSLLFSQVLFMPGTRRLLKYETQRLLIRLA